jgi:ABC-type antimicrobial peptide transport system permease subunit
MSETFFPVNDLFRRKLQTSLTVISLTGSVASTLFLLLFSSRLGIGLTSGTSPTLTAGLTAIFSQLVLFLGILVFGVGAVLTSFIVFLMMTQRTRDFGLIKAAGCPNSLVFGYFMTELLLVTLVGCVLGVAVGFGVDFAVAKLSVFAVYQASANVWLAPLVFVAFFVLALVFGTRPILTASRLSPLKALSSSEYFGLTLGTRLKPFSPSRLTGKIAFRSMSRRPSSALRIVLFLTIAFILLTVSIAGSVIARDTTTSWIEKAVGKNVAVVAHTAVAARYTLLQEKFSGTKETNNAVNYSSLAFAISNQTLQQLKTTPNVVKIDARLILQQHVYEVSNFTVDPDTQQTQPVGDSREGELLVVGVDPSDLTGSWFVQGRFLQNGDSLQAVVGDSVARQMFSVPLVQSLRVQNESFAIVGVCVDPINNGNVTYVPITQLEHVTGVSDPNIVFVQLDGGVNYATALEQLKQSVNAINQDLTVIELNSLVDNSLNFLGSAWSTMLLLPLFTLASATICLIAYVMLAVEEQRQEFAILRAIGAKPKTIVNIVAFQNFIILTASLALGISFGVIVTLLILIPYPVVNIFTILQIATWLGIATMVMFLLSIIPATRFARTPLLKILT